MSVLSFRNKILLLLVGCMCMTQVSTMLATLVSTEKTVRQAVDSDLKSAEAILDTLVEQRYQHLRQALEVALVDVGGHWENLSGRLGIPLVLFVSADKVQLEGSVNLQGGFAARLLEQLDRVSTIPWPVTATVEREHYQSLAVSYRNGWLVMGEPFNDALLARFRDMTGMDISIFDLLTKYSSNIASTLEARKEQLLIGELQNFGLLVNNQNDAFDVTLFDEPYLTRAHLLQSSSVPLFAILQKSLQKEMQPFQNIDDSLLRLFVEVIFVAVLGSVFISGSVIAPVKKLAGIAERIGHGNYDIDIKVKSRDEIGQLGSTLNQMQREISEREQKIVYQSQHDDLTDLPNRYLLSDRISSAIARADRKHQPFSLVMIDLARFKQVNDTLGHQFGDEILKITAARLGERLRKSDTLARMGGDDFMLLLEDVDISASLKLIDQDIQPLLAKTIHIANMDINLKYHFGFACFPEHGNCAETLLRRAEIALYEAKTSPGRSAVYENGRDETHIRELAIASDIDTAMNDGQLMLYYQPKVDLHSGDSAHAEALVRWKHPEFGWLPPDEFISVLEQTGNIEKLTAWIINEAARQCRVWRKSNLHVRISINLSALDLLNSNLPAVLTCCTQAHDIPAELLVLEITESAIMQDPVTARALLGQLRSLGYRIAIDDFGTGYSSLAQLKSLPVDELKIDKSFVLELTANSQDAVIVKSTIDLAHSMHLEVVAEGIENPEALQLLQDFGCNKGQGYYFSKPLSAQEFENWQRNNRQLGIVRKVDAA